MSNISFQKNPATAVPPGPVIDVQATPIVAPVEPVATAIPSAPVTSAVATVTAAVPVAPPQPPAFNDENISFDDIRVPRMNIVQKVGDLSNVFVTGEIVLAQELVIYSPAKGDVKATDPLTIIPLGFKAPLYAEKVGGGARGMLVSTREEVVAANGTLDYREWKASGKTKKRFEPLVTGLFLIKAPACVNDPDHQRFSLEIDGIYYALALWSMKGTAYTNAMKRFYTERKMGFLKRPLATAKNADGTPAVDRGYPSFAWTLTTKLEDYANDEGGKNYAVVPIITPGPKSSDNLLEFVKDGLGLR